METHNGGIPSEYFVREMEQHWINSLGNVTSEPLRQTWRQLADAFNYNITSHNDPELAKKWVVVQPATGTGKTQSSIVYCSILSRQAEHPGALIVTRLIEEANRIALQINEMTGREVALAHHSESETKLTGLREWPVLVITHRAYEQALDFLGQEGTIQQTWSFFHEWNGSRRKLIIIDECLDLVEHSQVDLDRLRATLGAFPQSLRDSFPEEVHAVQCMVDILEHMHSSAKDKPRAETLLLPQAITEATPPDFTALRSAFRNVRWDRQQGKDDLRENERLRKRYDEVIRSLHTVFRSWLYYSKINAKHTLNTARLLVPEEVKGAVVLDATASVNLIYQLFSNAFLLTPPQGARNYQNVTLHVSKGHRLGKVFMGNNPQKLCESLVSGLEGLLTGRDVFLITHKAVEPILISYETSFTMNTGHWGKVDGSNAWKDCDTCVVFGLPFRPDWWTANVFMAYQGPQETEWLRSEGNRPFGLKQDIRQALKLGQIVTEVVQAINRVQCRKVIDAEGNCPPTDVYLLLPGGDTDEILQGIQGEMPGVEVKDWLFSQQKVKKRVRRSNYESAFISFAQSMAEGRQSKSQIQKALGISNDVLKGLLGKVKDTTSELSAKIAEVGVTVEVKREGRTQRLYLVKEV